MHCAAVELNTRTSSIVTFPKRQTNFGDGTNPLPNNLIAVPPLKGPLEGEIDVNLTSSEKVNKRLSDIPDF